MYLAQGDDLLAELGIQDLTHSAVDSRQSADDTLKTGNRCNRVVSGKVTQRQQNKQHCQAAKDYLRSLVVLQRTHKHKCREDAPQNTGGSVKMQAYLTSSFHETLNTAHRRRSHPDSL